MEVKICYIDDNLDPYLVEALADFAENNSDYIYKEYELVSGLSYSDLLKHELINESDILIIDSRLFEEEGYTDSALTGEEFRFIVRKVFPYKEVLVISQNETREYNIESKFRPPRLDVNVDTHNYKTEAKNYYNRSLFPKIKECRKSIEATKQILTRISNKGYMSNMLLEQIRDTIKGDTIYTELSSKDIDYLIKTFNELRDDLNV